MALAQRVAALQERHQLNSVDEIHQQACLSAQAVAAKLGVLGDVLGDSARQREVHVCHDMSRWHTFVVVDRWQRC